MSEPTWRLEDDPRGRTWIVRGTTKEFATAFEWFRDVQRDDRLHGFHLRDARAKRQPGRGRRIALQGIFREGTRPATPSARNELMSQPQRRGQASVVLRMHARSPDEGLGFVSLQLDQALETLPGYTPRSFSVLMNPDGSTARCTLALWKNR